MECLISTVASLSLTMVAVACTATATTPAPVSPTASPTTSCPVTPFEMIPPNDVVGWAQPTWQRATVGVWGHPYLDGYTAQSGFVGTDPGVKILWWVTDDGTDPVVLDVASLGAGGFSASYSFDPPGVGRHDRPTGFTTPPPGCYAIRVTVGTRSGVIVDQVLP